ncbi:MAG: type II/IV secretion system protein [Oleispira sp.]|nr:type II/IV secretion system protein [Oleispira sp.]
MNSVADRPIALNVLLDDLKKDGLLDDENYQLAQLARRSQAELKMHPYAFVGKQKLSNLKTGKKLSEEVICEWSAEKTGLDYYRIDPLEVDVAAITAAMSYAFSERHKILAIKVNKEELVVACSEPNTTSWVQDLEHVSRRNVVRIMSMPSDIERHRVELYQLANSINSASTQHSGISGIQNLESMLELGKASAPDANDEHIVNVVDWLLQYAFEQRASDIHIEPRREIGNVRFRIDGVLHLVYELPAQVTQAVIARIKTLGRMNIAEKRKPQDSRLKTKTPAGEEIELRLSTLPTAFGEKLVMRVFDPSVLVRNFAELGFSKEDYRRWQQMTSQNNGIVFVTGPTGSGKTTTLYSTLKELATVEVNVSTIEDPIEMIEPAFNQMQVNHSIGLDFSTGVRALLRQDPDIIMVGEIRDLETAEMAVQSALTGHLVLSTLHTNDAPTAITRLLELGLPPYLIRSTMLGVMAQRLVRILCPHCKEEGEIDQATWKDLVAPWTVAKPAKIYHPKGCLECRDTGFIGRMGIYEVLPISHEISGLINDNVDHLKLRQQGMKEGMHNLKLSGAQKVAAGLTTVEEVMRVAPMS